MQKFRWGFNPPFAKELVKPPRINAVGETVRNQPFFRHTFASQRCVVPTTGFVEWKNKDKTKPMSIFIHHEGQRLPVFGMAGLYDVWTDPEGNSLRSFTIITTVPNEFMESIHNRMPVILDNDGINAWLNPKLTDKDFLEAFLQTFPSNQMQAKKLSMLVNSYKNDSAECLEEAMW